MDLITKTNYMNNLELYKYYKENYYKGTPVISDKEFDEFEEKLLIEYPNLRDEEIGWDDDSLQKFSHPTPMTSLNKFNLYGEIDKQNINSSINDWLQKFEDEGGFTVSPKYDGNAINAIYKNGKLWKVLSRGNGIEGRDYTNKMVNLPKTIPYTEDIIEFRGEVLMPLDIFNKKYSHFKNPRNFVAGILNRKDFNREHAKDLSIEFFDVRINNDIGKEIIIDECGLRTVYSYSYTKFDGSWNQFVDLYNELLNYRVNCNYYLDGFVIKVVEEYRESKVDGNPKDCVAIKFPPTESVTKIKNIEYNVGKTGDLTPVFILEPTLLDGTIVKRASGHNIKYIIDNKYFPGATVTISKSGDIIPQIRNVINYSNTGFIPPHNCPVCNSLLEFDNVNLKCASDNCSAKEVRKLNGIRMFGIEFLGGKTMEKLYESGITKIEDFFNWKFTQTNLVNSGNFKVGRQLEKMLNEINRLKEVELWQVIASLQFDNVGKTISKEYAKKLANIDYSFVSMDRKAIEAIDDERVFEFVELIETRGIKVNFPEPEIINENLINIEMTGSVNIEGIKTKSEFLKLFDNVNHTKLDKNTDYLITDDINSESSKMKKAKKLGVKTITYSDFIQKFK